MINNRMLMFEAYLKDTNQTKEEYDAKIKGKYDDDDNTAIPVIVPIHVETPMSVEVKLSARLTCSRKFSKV